MREQITDWHIEQNCFNCVKCKGINTVTTATYDYKNALHGVGICFDCKNIYGWVSSAESTGFPDGIHPGPKPEGCNGLNIEVAAGWGIVHKSYLTCPVHN